MPGGRPAGMGHRVCGGRRRPATSRVDTGRGFGGGGGGGKRSGYTGPSTARRSKPWTPPGGGWDSSPARAVPYSLRGVKAMTDEPWARDLEAATPSMSMEDGGGGGGGSPCGSTRDPAAAALSTPSGGPGPSPGGTPGGTGRPGGSTRARGGGRRESGRSHSPTLVQPEWDRSKELR
jgi:hypothetical protein